MRPDIDSQEEAWPQQFVIGNDETELELSVESRSFVNQVNDQVRKRQKRISNVAGEGQEHSIIWGMFMAVTMESAEKHQKISQEKFYSCRCSTTFPVEQETNEKECLANARLVSLYARKFGKGQWLFIGPGSEKSGTL